MRKDVKYTEMTSPFMEMVGITLGAVVLWLGGTQVIEVKFLKGVLFHLSSLFMMNDPVRLLFKTYTESQRLWLRQSACFRSLTKGKRLLTMGIQ